MDKSIKTNPAASSQILSFENLINLLVKNDISITHEGCYEMGSGDIRLEFSNVDEQKKGYDLAHADGYRIKNSVTTILWISDPSIPITNS